MAEQAVAKRQEIQASAPLAGGAIKPFIPGTPEEIKWVVGMVVGGGLAPDSYGDDQKKMALGIMKGLEVGMAPLTALQWIAIINGRPTIWGDGAIALVQNKGALAKMEEREIGTKPGEDSDPSKFPDDYGIEIKMWRKGQESPYVGTFTVGDAKRAKLWMNVRRAPWMQYPKRMLRMRAVGFAIRNGFADCLAGMMTREEVEDMPEMKDITPRNTGFLDAGLQIAGPNEEITVESAQAAAEGAESAEPEAGDQEPETAAPDAPEADYRVPCEFDDQGVPLWEVWKVEAVKVAKDADPDAFREANADLLERAPLGIRTEIEAALRRDDLFPEDKGAA